MLCGVNEKKKRYKTKTVWHVRPRGFQKTATRGNPVGLEPTTGVSHRVLAQPPGWASNLTADLNAEKGAGRPWKARAHKLLFYILNEWKKKTQNGLYNDEQALLAAVHGVINKDAVEQVRISDQAATHVIACVEHSVTAVLSEPEGGLINGGVLFLVRHPTCTVLRARVARACTSEARVRFVPRL